MAKEHNGLKWIGAIGTLIMISAMAVIGWIWNASKFQSAISTRVEINEKADELWHPQIVQTTQDYRVAVAEIRRDIIALQESTKETKTIQQQILTKQDEILRELQQ